MSKGGFVQANLDESYDRLMDALGGATDETAKALRSALNSTARKVRKQIVLDAKEQYAVSDNSLTNKALTFKGATKSNYNVILQASGPMKELMDFMVNPTTFARGSSSPSAYAAKVLSEGSMTLLNGSPKPFITQFKSGHIAIVTRVPGKRMKSNPHKEFVKKLLSPAVPHMLGNEEVRAQADAMVAELLPQQIEKQIKKMLKQRGKAA